MNNIDESKTSNAPASGDLQDSPKDKKSMESESVIIDLPDVKDIPGQEFIHPLPLGELADTTISSDDEEGAGILDEEETDISNTDINVTRAERKVLQQADEDMPTNDDTNLRAASLDNTDEDGTPLNEEGFGQDISSDDLNVPGTEEDDADEEIGEEDEENNEYSLGADKD